MSRKHNSPTSASARLYIEKEGLYWSYQDYINCSREALLEKMAELLPEKRLTHCLGVERAAMELAQRFGVDVEKASLAGLFFMTMLKSCQQ